MVHNAWSAQKTPSAWVLRYEALFAAHATAGASRRPYSHQLGVANPVTTGFRRSRSIVDFLVLYSALSGGCTTHQSPSGDDSSGRIERVAEPPLTADNTTQYYPFGLPDRRHDLHHDRMRVANISIGDTDATVRLTLGSPLSTTSPVFSEAHDDTIVAWQYPDVTVRLRGNHVYEVSCATVRCATVDGVRVGASRDTVVRIYGPGFKGYHRDRDVLLYFSREPAGCVLVFGFRSDRVTSLAMQCDFS